MIINLNKCDKVKNSLIRFLFLDLDVSKYLSNDSIDKGKCLYELFPICNYDKQPGYYTPYIRIAKIIVGMKEKKINYWKK